MLARDRSVALEGALGELVPDGTVVRGSVLRVTGAPGAGSTTVAFELAAAFTARGEWAAAVDLDGSLGPLAAGEAGVALERFAVVRRVPPARWATVVAALLEGVSVVVAEMPRGVGAGDARRLVARAANGSRCWSSPKVTGSGRGVLRTRSTPRAACGRASGVRPGSSPAAGSTSGWRVGARRPGPGSVSSPGPGDAVVGEPTRTCALWCPDWSVVAARRHDPGLVGVPVAVAERGSRGLVIRSASAEARAEGVVVGLRQREAEARCAGLVVLDADDAADARVFELVVRAVEELVPRLVLERPGQLSFPTRGPSRYFGGDDALAVRIVALVRDVGVIDARVGIAAGTFAAGLAARDALVIAPGESVAFLAAWPVTVLAGPVDAMHGGGSELVDLFVRLGVRTLGALAALPGAAVLGRFGPAGALAHRLACGEVEHEPVATVPPEELVETLELDPPATRVDEAAFAAKMLADRLLAHLDALGLCCTRVVVEAETEHGERLTRCWRHEGALTPATLVARVRWQLDAWLQTGGVTAGISLLQLAPDDLGPATGRQLGFWGGDPVAGDRAGRALVRVQGMLGPDAVVTAVAAGGRTPAERVRWVPWGEARDDGVEAGMPWPGTVPGPAPARVFDPPLAAELVDADGAPVTVSGRGEPSAVPVGLWCAALPGGGGPLLAWNGPWAHDLRWWDVRRRRALWQVVVGGDDAAGVACLVVLERGRAAVEAIYD